jgi:hypothetical protein
LLLLAALAAFASAQEIRSYTKKELYPAQICGDDGPGWEKLKIGDCPQGYNGLRTWAKANGVLTPSGQPVPNFKTVSTAAYSSQSKWPYCNPCNNANSCFEFKPGVAKCVSGFLNEGETCLDFSGSNGKYKPKELNPVLYGKSCQWPQFSCNWDAKQNNGVYTCQRVRDAAGKPTTDCYRAAGGRWWGGTDQWYTLVNDKFTPCGGPNPDYKSCKEYAGCGKLASTPFAGN